MDFIIGHWEKIVVVLLLLIFIFLIFNPRVSEGKLRIGKKEISFKKHRQIIRHHNQVVALEIVTAKKKKHISGKYLLTEGEHDFTCIATYADGTKDKYKPIWLRWSGGVSNTISREEIVTIHSSLRQEKYTELSAWVYEPSNDKSNAHIPYDSIGFEYPVELKEL